MKVANIQTVGTPDVSRNLDQASGLLAQAAREGAQLAILPEYFCLMGFNDQEKLDIAEQPGDGPIQSFLSAQAKKLGLFLIGGTVPLVSDRVDKVFNTSLVFDPEGRQIARYDKIHLFRFETSRESYDEGVILQPGRQVQTIQCGAIKVGLSTCYDLRFPELYRAMGRVDLIVVPSAFTYTTGSAHWEILLRARAIENQCYVAGCGQGGQHENGRRTWGHSMIIDPWGDVMAMHAEGPKVVMAELQPDKMNQIRQRLPALTHRVM